MSRVRDSLGDRMKGQYEDRTRYLLPRRTYTMIRVDGKSFHTYTKDLKRPFDDLFILCMDTAALAIVTEIQGAELAFVQSDEISVLLTDFANIDTCAAFDGNLQKICSVSASAATMAFNDTARDVGLRPTAIFDSRVFTIPDPVEVENYFIWRQKDAERNSIQSVAQFNATQKELHGKNIAEQHDIIHAAGDNWNNYPGGCKRGRVVVYNNEEWAIEVPPVFTKEREWLTSRIPRQWAESPVEPIEETTSEITAG